MSKIDICDICGKDLYWREVQNCTHSSFKIKTQRGRFGKYEETDICPDCINVIRDLVEKRRKEKE